MADDFLKNKTFGWNVIQNNPRTVKQIKETAQGLVAAPWEPLFNFFEENQDVFTGNVADKIERINLEMFNIGAQLKKGSTTTGALNLRG